MQNHNQHFFGQDETTGRQRNRGREGEQRKREEGEASEVRLLLIWLSWAYTPIFAKAFVEVVREGTITPRFFLCE